MSAVENGVPSGGEGTVSISDDGHESVPGEQVGVGTLACQVGVWFLDEDDNEWVGFQCDGCGSIDFYMAYDLPIELGGTCDECGGIAVEVLGAVDALGQVSLLTPDEAARVASFTEAPETV